MLDFFSGKTVAMTGATSQVGLPIVRALAGAGAEVLAIGRFGGKGAADRVSQAGGRPVKCDLVAGEFSELPRDVDYVLNFAVAKEGNWERDILANVEGLGLLIAHLREAKALLHCSSTAVYEPAGLTPLKETDPLGDNHKSLFPTYSICKIAAETAARTAARLYDLPTTVARLCVPYGDNGGWPYFHMEMMLAGMDIPISGEAENRYSLLHEDDYIAMLPALLEAASVPATVVNWGGSEPTSIEEWTKYIGELVGVEPKLVVSDTALSSISIDPEKMHALVGRTQVDWRDGIRRMIKALRPDLGVG